MRHSPGSGSDWAGFMRAARHLRSGGVLAKPGSEWNFSRKKAGHVPLFKVYSEPGFCRFPTLNRVFRVRTMFLDCVLSTCLWNAGQSTDPVFC